MVAISLMLSVDALNQLPLAVGYKDLDSNYLGGNTQLAQYMGYQHAQDIIGLRDSDIRHDMASLAAQFIKQDKQVIEQGEQRHLDIGRYQDGDIHIHFSTKQALIENDEVAGVIFTCQEMFHSEFSSIYPELLGEEKAGFYHIREMSSF